MAFLHTHSSECMNSELVLFSLPATQTSIENSRYLHYKPVSSLSDENDAPIEFVVPSASEFYIDLAHTMLYIQAKITPVSNDDAENAKVAPVNNTLHSFFSQIDIFFNQKLVSLPNNLYPYRAYIETLLCYSSEAKNSHLSSSLFYSDQPGNFEAFPNAAAANANGGLLKRQKYTLAGRSSDIIGHLHPDVFNQDKMLLNGVELRVRLVRSKDAFCLMDASADGKFRVQIKEASLMIRCAKISPGVLLAHANALSKTTAKYPITRVEVKSFTMHAGILGDTLDNVVLGRIPKRIIIEFVLNKSFNGNRKTNPFNFQHFNVNYLSLYVDGVQLPSEPVQ